MNVSVVLRAAYHADLKITGRLAPDVHRNQHVRRLEMIRQECSNLIARKSNGQSTEEKLYECWCSAGEITPFAHGGMLCPGNCSRFWGKRLPNAAGVESVEISSPFEGADRPAA